MKNIKLLFMHETCNILWLSQQQWCLIPHLKWENKPPLADLYML